MRDLVKRYFDNNLSRRGFARRLAQLGFTSAAASELLAGFDASDGAPTQNTTRAGTPPSSTVEGSGGDLVVAQVKAAGVKYIFTNPGSYEVAFFDSLLDQPALQPLIALHEGVVISMADGYHRVSLEPAFVNVHVIAGTAQAAGQMYNAGRDGSALVFTAGLNDNEAWSDESILAPRPGYDQKEVNRQFTKISWEARQPASLPLMLRRAFKVAMTPPGGPVYLAMAHYALERKNVKAEILPARRFLAPSRVRPDSTAVDQAAKLLLDARRPLLICGDEVWKSGAVAELVALSEKLALPVAKDRAGYCNFPATHSHNIGSFSPNSTWISGADTLLFVGARDAGGRVVPAASELPSSARIIRLGMDTSSMGRNYSTDVPLVSDVKAGLKDLLAAIDSIATRGRLNSLSAARAPSIRSHNSAVRARLAAAVNSASGHSPVHPDELGAILARTLDKNAIIVSENLTGKYDSFPFGYREDELMYLSNTGLGLGWGIGAATGAKVAAPHRQVVCTIGDGSVMYSASGFWTQARYAIPVLTIVYNNKNYQTVRMAYDSYHGKMAASGKYVGMYLGDPDIDFVKLAESQGVKGEKAATAAELEAAVKRGANANRDGKPYLVEVPTARYGGGAESTWHDGFHLPNPNRRA